jgi:hypothetical protein
MTPDDIRAKTNANVRATNTAKNTADTATTLDIG